MNKLSEKLVLCGFSFALLLLGSVGFISYLSIQKLNTEKRWIIHTYQVIENIDHLKISFANVIRTHNNYIFTSRASEQEDYQQHKQEIYHILQNIRKLTIDNVQQQNRLAHLEPLISKKFFFLDKAIDLSSQQKLDKVTQRVLSEQNIELRGKIQTISQAIEDSEKSLLEQRTRETDALFQRIIIMIGLGYSVSCFLLVGVYLLLQKQISINKALSQDTIRLEKQAAKAKIADILETVTDAFVSLDSNWCYTYVNQRAGQIFHRHPADLVGKNIWQEFPEGVGQKFYHAYHQAMTEQRVIEMEEYYPPWNRWFENRIYPSSEGLSIFFQDITRRKLAEISLEKNEKRYRSLVNATAQAVWTTNADGLVVEDMPSWRALTGQSETDIQGWGWLEAIHPEDRERTAQMWTQAVETKSIYQMEHRIRVADGIYRFFSVRGVPILDDNKHIQEWVGISTDITERRLAEITLQQTKAELEIKVQERTAELQNINQELNRSNQELEQFAYIASHDLQEPLRAVTGYTQLLAQEYAQLFDGSAQEYLTYIVDGAKRMQQLIQDLLVYSRVGTRSQAFTLTDCHTALDEAMFNLQLAIAESNATITHDSLPQLVADKTQLVQLFQNLIGNAIKFRRQEPLTIHISAVRQDVENKGTRGQEDKETRRQRDNGTTGQGENTDISSFSPHPPLSSSPPLLLSPSPPLPILRTQHSQWLFSVQDNGIGIKSQYLERIFEIFRRLHTRRQFPGTGIGLAICKKIVERHGGTIWAESQLGVGTTFYFTFPED
ncbi:PAS domain S-box protein [Nostoc sp. TCL26-01]|uniref:PAS domain S-box protein n=1 Tax=Nostoc sp. TCL26-01 TaxID=2576904 RepID=UPI0015BDB608|nr:PAS domain S-box protein [Nostoc sp. TCL26-01]QLE58654.1 PAS domain S-box protein [Nostoc sp. TCL26-01]